MTMELRGIDKAALNIMKLCWLIQALVCQAVLPLIKDNWELEFKVQNMVMSGWVLFHDAEHMLPPEQMAQVLIVGRFLLALIVLSVLWQVCGALVEMM